MAIKKETLIIIFIIAASLAVTLFCQKQGITSKYIIHDDVVQYVPPIYALHKGALNDALLDNDLMLKYMVIKDSPGHLYLYYIFSFFIDPLALSKVLPFILAPLGAVLLFLIGKKLKNTTVGFFSSFIFLFYIWTLWFGGFLAGGYAKAFAFPIFFFFLYFLLSKNQIGCLAVLIMQILFYPPVAVISLMIYLFDLLEKKGNAKKEILFFIISSLVCFILAYLIYKRPNDFLGPEVSLSEMLRMPEFGPFGRDPLFGSGILNFLKSEDMSSIFLSPVMPYLSACFLIAAFYLGKKLFRLPAIIFHIFITGIIAFLLAYIFLFFLFFPGRYLEYTLPIFLILVSAFAIEKLIASTDSRKIRAFLYIFFICMITSLNIPYLKENVFNYNRLFYKFVMTTPEDSLIAGHPYDMDPVTTFTKRKVLVQFELSNAWYKNYYSKVEERTRDLFGAYYSDSLGDIYKFFKKYNINYLVVNKSYFNAEYLRNKQYYIQPFNDYIDKLVRKNEGKFVLMDSKIINKYKVYEDAGGYFIISFNKENL
ncbi:MAG: hypothetical protein PHH69_00280 [Candidatus Omnitrophica bacterium]|nr:hypothetical protein [Candidatus Omnitrophota bacterium]